MFKNIYKFLFLILFVFNISAFNISDDRLIQNTIQFSWNLFDKVDTSLENQNIFISPISLWGAMVTPYIGSDSNTREELRKVFGYLYSSRNTISFYDSLLNRLTLDQTLKIAGKMYVNIDLNLNTEFENLVSNNNKDFIEVIDFKDLDKTTNKINRWVIENTNGKISKIVNRNLLTAYPASVILNAIYFKEDWIYSFDETLTDTNFKWNDYKGNQSSTCQMMKQEDYFGYFENEIVQVLELPYKGNKFSMIIFLPTWNDRKNKYFSISVIKDWLQNIKNLNDLALEEKKVNVNLPKFTLDSSYEFKDNLKSLGVYDAFSSKADFSLMTGTKELYISSLIQKTFLNVDEKGTEVATISFIGMETMSISFSEQFVVDHPFLFVIKHNQTGLPVFIGKIIDPTL